MSRRCRQTDAHARDPQQTINRLIAVLDTREIAEAVTRLKVGFGLKVVK
jgi:hypothetical protein